MAIVDKCLLSAYVGGPVAQASWLGSRDLVYSMGLGTR